MGMPFYQFEVVEDTDLHLANFETTSDNAWYNPSVFLINTTSVSRSLSLINAFHIKTNGGRYGTQDFVVNGYGKVGIGTTAPMHRLSVVTDSSPDPNVWPTSEAIGIALHSDSGIGGGGIVASMLANDSHGAAPEFTTYRARGTHAYPENARTGDLILKMAGVALTAGAWAQVAHIKMEADAGFGEHDLDAPGRIRFGVRRDGGGRIPTVLMIRSSGNVGIGIENPQSLVQLDEPENGEYKYLQIDSAKSAPPGEDCDEPFMGRMFYNAADDIIYVCDGNSWKIH